MGLLILPSTPVLFLLRMIITKKRIDILTSTPNKFKKLQILVEIFTIPPRQDLFFQGNFFNSAPVCLTAVATNTTSAFTRLSTKKPIQFH